MPRIFRNFLLVLLLAGAAAPGHAAVFGNGAAPEAIAALLQGDGDLRVAGRLLDRPVLLAFYQPRNFIPIWTAERRDELIRALAEAGAQGLDPTRFMLPEVAPAPRELLLTSVFLRYAAALAHGQVNPTEIESDWLMPVPGFDPQKLLARMLATSVTSVLATLPPKEPAYLRLIEALARYRADTLDARWRPISLSVPRRPGDKDADVETLRQRLSAEGFDAGTGDEFDDGLRAAVMRFQGAHGLAQDGTVGRGTLAALNVAPAARVRQIRLNLERWRSLPRDWAATRVEVNVAAASAVLYKPDEAPLAMRAIVGAPDHPTPLLRARMVAVLLNPPWKVPSSIIEKEIRPALKRDPKYLQRNNFAYVEVPGGRELQQLPGPKNALGLIKFEMPNLDDIYLHDTPARYLFQSARRAYSHGCVRLEDPRALATEVLAGAPDWPRSAIDDAIATGVTQRVALPHTLPVYVLYFTAFVDEDGTVEFRDDVYGRDRRLAAALDGVDDGAPLARAVASQPPPLTKSLSDIGP